MQALDEIFRALAFLRVFFVEDLMMIMKIVNKDFTKKWIEKKGSVLASCDTRS